MTMTTSHWRASSIAAFCRCLVGRQTVSMKRTCDRGNRSRISATSRCTLSRGCVVCDGDAESRAFAERPHVVFVLHDVEVVEVFGEAPHFDMAALADDDRVIAVAEQGMDGAMRDAHERAGRFHDLQAERAGGGEGSFGRAVRRDHHGLASSPA